MIIDSKQLHYGAGGARLRKIYMWKWLYNGDPEFDPEFQEGLMQRWKIRENVKLPMPHGGMVRKLTYARQGGSFSNLRFDYQDKRWRAVELTLRNGRVNQKET
jgi:hypothetical protein